MAKLLMRKHFRSVKTNWPSTCKLRDSLVRNDGVERTELLQQESKQALSCSIGLTFPMSPSRASCGAFLVILKRS
ncbi:hypothetical protein VUR80DRAFT_988 [Thermomyces stellatus]